jgi:hypothetical protein
MLEETKNVIYMSLDLLNSLSKTSDTKSNFINIDENTLRKVREELFDMLKDQSSKPEELRLTHKVYNIAGKNVNKKLEIIGLLPYILIDKGKFPENKDIAKLAQESLNLEIPFWKKRSRNEIIGNLIAMIATKEDKDLDLFFKAWKEFTQKDTIQIENWKSSTAEENKNPEKRDFVDIWLEFFNHYKGN